MKTFILFIIVLAMSNIHGQQLELDKSLIEEISEFSSLSRSFIDMEETLDQGSEERETVHAYYDVMSHLRSEASHAYYIIYIFKNIQSKSDRKRIVDLSKGELSYVIETYSNKIEFLTKQLLIPTRKYIIMQRGKDLLHLAERIYKLLQKVKLS